MTWQASLPLFACLIGFAVIGASLAAIVLAVLIVRDWCRGQLW